MPPGTLLSLPEIAQAVLARLADGRFHSGQALAGDLKISRTTVWQHVQWLRALGVEIQAVAGRGYRLTRPLELLDQERIVSALDLPPGCPLPSVEIYACLPSTNTYLLETAAAHPSVSVCLAEAQTRGKGRLGRTWTSPFGYNLYFSLLWRFACGESLSGLSLAAGVAVLRELLALGFPQLQLKWPNDILWQGKKLGGILIEAVTEPQGQCVAVIGLGLNLWLPAREAAAIDQPWVDGYTILGESLPSRNLIAAKLIRGLLALLCAYSEQGITPWLEEWRLVNCVLGRNVEVIQAGQRYEAIAVDVTEDGFLIVQRQGQHQILAAGEVRLKLHE